MRKFKPVDYIIAALVILLSTLLLMTGIAPLIKGVALSGEKAKLLSGAVSSLISVITLYVGAKLQENRDKSRHSDKYNRENDKNER